MTVKIKQGVKFGPPVNREVTSDDVKYAFERFPSEQVRVSTRATSEHHRLARRPRPTGVKEIAGIETPDDKTIVFKLKDGTGVCARVLARDADHDADARGLRGEVRREEPVDVQHARRRDRPVHGQERRAGQHRRLQGGQVDHLVRNPNWDKSTDYRPAYLDEID